MWQRRPTVRRPLQCQRPRSEWRLTSPRVPKDKCKIERVLPTAGGDRVLPPDIIVREDGVDTGIGDQIGLLKIKFIRRIVAQKAR